MKYCILRNVDVYAADCLTRARRDLFDVYQITGMRFDRETFRLCAVVDSLTRGKPKFNEINVEKSLGKISIDSSLRNLLQANSYRDFDFKEMVRGVVEFSEEIVASLTGEETRAITRFFENKVFEPELFDDKSSYTRISKTTQRFYGHSNLSHHTDMLPRLKHVGFQARDSSNDRSRWVSRELILNTGNLPYLRSFRTIFYGCKSSLKFRCSGA